MRMPDGFYPVPVEYNKVYKPCGVCKRTVYAVGGRNIEIWGTEKKACNTLILLSCGHYMTDDCTVSSRLTGRCYRTLTNVKKELKPC